VVLIQDARTDVAQFREFFERGLRPSISKACRMRYCGANSGGGSGRIGGRRERPNRNESMSVGANQQHAYQWADDVDCEAPIPPRLPFGCSNPSGSPRPSHDRWHLDRTQPGVASIWYESPTVCAVTSIRVRGKLIRSDQRPVCRGNETRVDWVTHDGGWPSSPQLMILRPRTRRSRH